MGRVSAGYRWSVASRAVAAIAGGYVFTWLFTASLAVLLRDVWAMARVDAMLTATMAGLLIYAVVGIAVFTARSAARAWIVLVAATASAGLVLALVS